MATPQELQAPLYFSNPLNANCFFASIVTFDSAPVQCFLEDSSNLKARARTRASKELPNDAVEDDIPERKYDGNPDAFPNELVFENYAGCVPLRLITMSELNCRIAVSIYVIKPRLFGVVDLRVLLSANLNREALGLVTSLRFPCYKAAGDFVHLQVIGYHIGIVSRFNSTFLTPPRYSGTWLPFHSVRVSNSTRNPNVFNPQTGRPYINVYGNGFNTEALRANSDQVAPFVCRPVEADRDARSVFRGLANSLMANDSQIVNASNEDQPNTRVGMYRTPFYNDYSIPDNP